MRFGDLTRGLGGCLARHPRGLFGTAALLLLPTLILAALAGPLARWEAIPLEVRQGTAGNVAAFVMGALALALFVIGNGVVIAYLDRCRAGAPLPWGAAWRASRARAGHQLTAAAAVLPAWLLIGFLIHLPFFLVFRLFVSDGGAVYPQPFDLVPAAITVAYLATRYAFLGCVAVLEGAGGFAALARNRAALRGRFREVAVVMMPVALAGFGLGRVWALALPDPFDGAGAPLFLGLTVPIGTALATLLYLRGRGANSGPLSGTGGSAGG